jgi:hypothetical protein
VTEYSSRVGHPLEYISQRTLDVVRAVVKASVEEWQRGGNRNVDEAADAILAALVRARVVYTSQSDHLLVEWYRIPDQEEWGNDGYIRDVANHERVEPAALVDQYNYLVGRVGTLRDNHRAAVEVTKHLSVDVKALEIALGKGTESGN